MAERIPGVKELIAQRIKTKSKPKDRDDPYKLGLVIEGGSMRTVVSAGMVVGIEALDAAGACDAMYVTSGGSGPAVYTLSRQTPEGTSIFYQDINNPAFINPKRFLRGEPIVDIPFLTHEVMWNRKPLDWERVTGSDVPIHIYITRADTAEIVDFSRFTTRESIHDALHLTCRMLYVAGPPYKYQDGLYTDGVVIAGGIPLKQAIENGCSHILVLLTRPEGRFRTITVIDRLVSLRLNRQFPNLAKRFWEGFRNYNQALAMIEQAKHVEELPKIEAIQVPASRREISRLERNADILIQGAFDGYNSVMEQFAQFNLPINEDVKVIV